LALRRWGDLLPRVPAGDVLVFGSGATEVARDVRVAMERLDKRLSQWPVAGVLFLALTAVLVGTMLAGR
jgi:multicomponent Na+:H+ antiporter subunit A